METLKRKCLLCEAIMTLGPRQGKTRYCRACARLVKRMQVNKCQRRRRELAKKRRGLVVSKAEHPKPETRNQKPETRNQKPETRNPKPETRNSKPETLTLTRGGIRQAMICAGMQGVRTLDGIMAAKAKPPHMSDVRWRIELRRRANPGWYDLLPEHPVLPVARPATASDLGY